MMGKQTRKIKEKFITDQPMQKHLYWEQNFHFYQKRENQRLVLKGKENIKIQL